MTEKEIPESELILNEDGSVYHLHLLPEDLAEVVFFVGDPERVPEVSKHFDRITVKKQKREFVTHSGFIGKKYVTVISTGIGTDNIDIVLNELDALANINLQERKLKDQHISLKIIRIGTSGSLQKEIPVDSILASSHGLGLDGLMNYYQVQKQKEETNQLRLAISRQLNLDFIKPYLFEAPGNLQHFYPDFISGITATCCGFYAPQGRQLRGVPMVPDLIDRLHQVEYDQQRITNFEMETAGIYGLATLLGHEAISINAIMANRITHQFCADPPALMDKTIRMVLDKIERI